MSLWKVGEDFGGVEAGGFICQAAPSNKSETAIRLPHDLTTADSSSKLVSHNSAATTRSGPRVRIMDHEGHEVTRRNACMKPTFVILRALCGSSFLSSAHRATAVQNATFISLCLPLIPLLYELANRN